MQCPFAEAGTTQVCPVCQASFEVPGTDEVEALGREELQIAVERAKEEERARRTAADEGGRRQAAEIAREGKRACAVGTRAAARLTGPRIRRKQLAVLLLIMAAGVAAFLVQHTFRAQYSFELTVKMRDRESATLVPLEGAYAFAVPAGSACDAILSEYNLLARSSLKTRAEAYAVIEENRLKADALDAQTKSISSYSRPAGDAARELGDTAGAIVDEYVAASNKLAEIKDSLKQLAESSEKNAKQFKLAGQEYIAEQREYRNRAIHAAGVQHTQQTDANGQARWLDLQERNLVIYVMPTDLQSPMLLMRKIDAGVVSAAVVGPEDDILLREKGSR
jgi:hypothetical protein